jgi:hypothetical protein
VPNRRPDPFLDRRQLGQGERDGPLVALAQFQPAELLLSYSA